MRFTGRAGRDNLQQAFDFYRFVLAHCSADEVTHHSVLDFGGGWGRILRFFLREFPANQLLLADCLTEAVECARSLNPPFTVLHSSVTPPLPLPEKSVGVCYAFSVFSHLSESASRDWLAHLGTLLVDGGKLIITTRGKKQIAHVRHLSRQRSLRDRLRSLFGSNPVTLNDNLSQFLPPAYVIEQRRDDGVFQFYPTGGGGELDAQFYGETWIPEAWIKDNCGDWGFSGYQTFEEFQTIDQQVYILTKSH